MGERRRMRSQKREKEKLLKDRAALVRAAMNEANKFTRKDICEASGLTMVQLKNLFQEDRELYAEYVVIRKTITDIASDNIFAIINDPTHPQHFQASKYVLQNYKSDLDETLESADSILSIETSNKGSKNPVKIVFSPTDGK